MQPKAREENLLVHEVDGEMIVYDRESKQAHRLNSSAAAVWQTIDGAKSLDEVAEELSFNGSVVQLALDDLSHAGLLVDLEPLSVSRRSALRKVATAAAVGLILPAVTSIPAPLAAQSRSQGAGGETIKLPGTKQPKIKLPKIKIPKIKVPKLKLPNIK